MRPLRGEDRFARILQNNMIHPGQGRLSDIADFGSNPGGLRARTYIPADLPSGAPLVVVLHGCTQTAADYDHGSGWSSLADRHGFALLLLLCAVATLPAQTSTTAPGRTQRTTAAGDAIHQRAIDLLAKMTVEEKAGQLNQAAGIVMPGLSPDKPDEKIRQGRVGSLLWLIGVQEINRVQRIAVEQSRLHIPLLVGFDVVHG